MKRILTIAIASILIVGILCALAGCGETVVKDGLSAYDIAVKNGFSGTEKQWLESLKEGESAYDIAIKNGYEGTEEEWLASLNGKDGTNGTNGKDGEDATFTINDVYEAYKTAYQEENGTEYTGTFGEFLEQYFADAYRSTSREGMVAEAVFSCLSVYSYFEGFSSPNGGAGIIYKLDKTTGSAYILTNYHVVYNKSASPQISEDIVLLMYGQERVPNEEGTDYKYGIPATYIGGSMKLDVAVLYVENSEVLKNSNAKEVVLGDSNELSMGQDAIAIGNPAGNGVAVTNGIVSVDSEFNRMYAADGTTVVNFRVIRIDTAINGGNSGGGLFDAYGRLIGIVHAKVNSSAAENIAYAIPINIAVYTADGLIERFEKAGKVGAYAASKCLLGITISLTDSYAYYDTTEKRVRVVETVAISEDVAETAAAYGKLQKGDVIKKITIVNTATGETRAELNATRTFIVVDSMLLAREGDTIYVEYERGGETATAEIVVTSTTEIDSIGN